mmetsp:Transcript_14251/g.46794  ORF Transcript_14251/g.46794 Transcript_14251/m.46794 type:complete len:278 (-) Transcript_14251:108-941(-)
MGNAQAPGRGREEPAPASPPDSPSMQGSPSPLSFGPQIPMAPMPKPEEFSLSERGAGRQAVGAPGPHAGWPAQPTLVPTSITWTHGGNHVEVEGSFDNWTTRQAMAKTEKDFTAVKLLHPGVYQYKFIVDGEWRYAPDQPAMYDEMGNVNNVVEVLEYLPDNLDSLSDFRTPPSPTHSYNNPPPMPDDYAKEPPALPPQLQLTLLNVPNLPEAPNLLPRPQHVVLNHVYQEKSRTSRGISVLGTTHRYKGKWVTCVVIKPSVHAAGWSSEATAMATG